MWSGTRILLGIVFTSQSENNETVSDKMSHATGRSRWIFAVSELCAAASPWAKTWSTLSAALALSRSQQGGNG